MFIEKTKKRREMAKTLYAKVVTLEGGYDDERLDPLPAVGEGDGEERHVEQGEDHSKVES